MLLRHHVVSLQAMHRQMKCTKRDLLAITDFVVAQIERGDDASLGGKKSGLGWTRREVDISHQADVLLVPVAPRCNFSQRHKE